MASSYKHISIFLISCIANMCLISSIEATKNGGITLDLIHRDSQHSLSYDPTNTRFDRIKGAVYRSFSRLSAIRKISKKSTINSTDAMKAPIILTGGEYLMKIQIGTPSVDLMAIADTGSDLLWTQCEPCTQCYKQNSPFFDPKNTNSYKSVSCQSDQCNAITTASCDDSNNCKYQMSYGDKSYSIGDLATETITFNSNSGENVSFPNVVFGCGHNNAGTFNETASGIIGLGGGSLSIIHQLEKSIGGIFSYCLTSTDSQVSGKIKFGTNAIVTGPNVVSTPIVRKSPETYYYLTLEGISVANKMFEYNSNNDYTPSGDEGNIIIDSGTTITFLPEAMYKGIESELVNAINGTRGTDSSGSFNLCYNVPSDGGEFNPPTIVAHFSGADVVLPQGSTFVEVQQGMVCLTLIPSEDLAIFGNLHQINYQIGYDLENLKVNFLPTDCSKSG